MVHSLIRCGTIPDQRSEPSDEIPQVGEEEFEEWVEFTKAEIEAREKEIARLRDADAEEYRKMKNEIR